MEDERGTPESPPQVKRVRRILARIMRTTRTALVGAVVAVAGIAAVTIGMRHIPQANHQEDKATDGSFPSSLAQETKDLLTYQGRILGTFKEEQQRNPNITVDAYLDLLAEALDTPEKFRAFLTTYTAHVDELNAPFPIVSGSFHTDRQDYWQTAGETAQRSAFTQGRARMLGDCEDLAFFAQAILHRQRKPAHVISLDPDGERGHATCLWVERTKDGRYNGYNFDGLFDRNGDSGPPNTPPQEGYRSLREAIEETLRGKYDKNITVNPLWIPVSRIRTGRIRHSDFITIQAFDPDHPLPLGMMDVGIATGILGGMFAAYRIRKWKKRTGERKYFRNKKGFRRFRPI